MTKCPVLRHCAPSVSGYASVHSCSLVSECAPDAKGGNRATMFGRRCVKTHAIYQSANKGPIRSFMVSRIIGFGVHLRHLRARLRTPVNPQFLATTNLSIF